MATHGLSAGRYLYGVAALALVAASLGYAAVLLRRRHLAGLTGSIARLAEFVLGLGLLVAELEVLGALGLFRLGPAVVVAVAVGLISWRGWGRTPPLHARVSTRQRRRSFPAALDALGLAGAASVIAEWTGLTIDSYHHGIRTFDTLWYHLPWAASFAQTGNVVSLRFTDVEYLTPFYPANAELLHGLGIVLLGGDVLSPILNLGFLALALLAASCIGRPFGVAPLTTLGASIALGTPALLLSQAGSAANDVVGVAFLLCAVALVVNAPEESAALALAAVAAGLAVGVKLSLLAPVAALTVGLLVRRRGRRPALAWLVPLFLAGGYWYLRNLIAVGNPLPWVSIPGLATPAAAFQSDTGFSIAHYLGHPSVWAGILQPGLASDLGSWWWALLAGVVGGTLLATGLPRRDPRVQLVGAVALVSVLAYLITPETAAGPAGHPTGFAFNLRYAAPALALCLIALGLLPGVAVVPASSNGVHGDSPRRPLWTRRVLGGAMAVALAITIASGNWWHHVPGQLIAAAILIAIAAVAAFASRRVAAAAAVAAALLVAALGFPAQRDYFRHRYTYSPGVSSLSPIWAMFRTIHDRRVGIVGTYGGFFAYPLYGIDASDRVAYIGARGAHGSFTPIQSCRAWRTAVNDAHLDLLLTTPARDPWHPHRLHPSPEGSWTQSDPATQVLYRRTTTGQPITLFAIHGRLDPATCG